MSKLTAVILAAGKGTRMRSQLPKVLHRVGGKPMVEQVLDTVEALGVDRSVVVVGFGAEAVRAQLGNRVLFAQQEEQKGTGHALQMTEPLIGAEEGTILLLCGDTPLLRTETLADMLDIHRRTQAAATVLTAHMDNPTGYGRILRDAKGGVLRIVEQKDATPEERAVQEVNAGVYAFESAQLWPMLAQLDSDNAQGELYVTDVIGLLVAAGQRVSAATTFDVEETLGVNARSQLAEAERILRRRALDALLDAGVTIMDPATTYVEVGVRVGPDTILYPGTWLEGDTSIGAGCRIGPYTRLTDVVVEEEAVIQFTYAHECRIGARAQIGPYVHLRPGTTLGEGVRVGNFVEVKNTTVGTGAKLPHLSYIGDSDVGARVNVGCGTITVNYDGKHKHRTVIEEGAFIGCNANLVAPVVIGREAFVGAGTTITKDVPSRALAVGRSKSIIKEQWVTDSTFKK